MVVFREGRVYSIIIKGLSIKMSRKRKLLFTLVLVILIGVGAIFYVLSQAMPQNVAISCLDGIPTNASPDEISRILNIPLVILDTLPSGISDDPQVTLDVDYPLERPICGLRISYFGSANERPDDLPPQKLYQAE